MPVYEYKCEDCGHEFEELTRGEEQVQCPECESEQVEKLISKVNVGNPSCEGKTCSCNSCGL